MTESFMVKRSRKISARAWAAGSHADNNLGFQCGGWSSIEHLRNRHHFSVGTTILGAIRKTIHQPTEVIFEETPDTNQSKHTKFVKSNNFSGAIVAVGELPYAKTP
ncbi:unnamed protein product [Coffea canephora]|uniref:beta-glucosidase n=1 Tax=Coffea canephora TaxID=49390 RepID=A0A068USC8_COFCA|nr:unnamed protein product [Coffea canephora]